MAAAMPFIHKNRRNFETPPHQHPTRVFPYAFSVRTLRTCLSYALSVRTLRNLM
jgi:hypothetical protein